MSACIISLPWSLAGNCRAAAPVDHSAAGTWSLPAPQTRWLCCHLAVSTCQTNLMHTEEHPSDMCRPHDHLAPGGSWQRAPAVGALTAASRPAQPPITSPDTLLGVLTAASDIAAPCKRHRHRLRKRYRCLHKRPLPHAAPAVLTSATGFDIELMPLMPAGLATMPLRNCFAVLHSCMLGQTESKLGFNHLLCLLGLLP